MFGQCRASPRALLPNGMYVGLHCQQRRVDVAHAEAGAVRRVVVHALQKVQQHIDDLGRDLGVVWHVLVELRIALLVEPRVEDAEERAHRLVQEDRLLFARVGLQQLVEVLRTTRRIDESGGKETTALAWECPPERVALARPRVEPC